MTKNSLLLALLLLASDASAQSTGPFGPGIVTSVTTAPTMIVWKCTFIVRVGGNVETKGCEMDRPMEKPHIIPSPSGTVIEFEQSRPSNSTASGGVILQQRGNQ